MNIAGEKGRDGEEREDIDSAPRARIPVGARGHRRSRLVEDDRDIARSKSGLSTAVNFKAVLHLHLLETQQYNTLSMIRCAKSAQASAVSGQSTMQLILSQFKNFLS